MCDPIRLQQSQLDAAEKISVFKIVYKLIRVHASSAAVYNLKSEIDNNNLNRRRTDSACLPPSISKEQRTTSASDMDGSFPEKMCRVTVNSGQ